ncbi:RebB family R body protein [Phenylobacterium soli]|nr:RebB family R body protein [Phenylobacterium soli]
MRTIAMSLALAMTAGTALAQTGTPAASNNLGQQNAVSNQQSHSQLGVAAPNAELSHAAHNATNGQQQRNTVDQASTTQGVSLGYGSDTSATAVGIAQILDAGQAKPADKDSAEAKPRP